MLALSPVSLHCWSANKIKNLLVLFSHTYRKDKPDCSEMFLLAINTDSHTLGILKEPFIARISVTLIKNSVVSLLTGWQAVLYKSNWRR